MADVGAHFTNLWFAGDHANWPLAQFCLDETKSHLRWAVRIIPKRKDAEKRFHADRDGFVEIVFVVEKGKAVAKQVETGIQSDDLIEVLTGLAEGNEVVSGSYRAISKDLENGAVVAVNNNKDVKKTDESKVVGSRG